MTTDPDHVSLRSQRGGKVLLAWLFRLGLLIAMVVIWPAPAATDTGAAEKCPEPEVPADVVTDLVGWIALHTMYDVTGLVQNLPDITFCELGDRIAYEEIDLAVEPGLRAVYDLPRRQIFLVLPWSHDNLVHRSVLLHEMVHVVQLDDRVWPCTGAPELEAYLLQAQYLEEHGIKADFDWGAIFLLSICPPMSK